jgi:Nucleotidyl transferase AbiEii toxin, Type IV TA system
MDPFHERLARVALNVAATYGFALAGGYAIAAHGFLDRPSADVDLFAEASAEFNFPEAVDAVVAAYQRDGLEACTEAQSSSFARLIVSTSQEQARVELGVDWRVNEPIRLAIGPVLHADDAVANKVCALFGRAEIRDYVDVAAILSSGRYSDDDLIRLAAEHDPGFDLAWFTEALEAVDRIPDTGFAEYGLDPARAAAVRSRMHAWAKKINGS